MSPSQSLNKFDIPASSLSFSLPRRRAPLSQSLTHSPVLTFPKKPSTNSPFFETPNQMNSQANHYINYKSPVNNIFNINVNSNVTLSK